MKKKAKLDEFLTVRELAEWIRLSESHVYFLVNKKKIPFVKLGGKLLFDREKIRGWIDSNSKAPVQAKTSRGRKSTNPVLKNVKTVQ